MAGQIPIFPCKITNKSQSGCPDSQSHFTERMSNIHHFIPPWANVNCATCSLSHHLQFYLPRAKVPHRLPRAVSSIDSWRRSAENSALAGQRHCESTRLLVRKKQLARMYLTHIKLETFPLFSHWRTKVKDYIGTRILQSKLMPSFSRLPLKAIQYFGKGNPRC